MWMRAQGTTDKDAKDVSTARKGTLTRKYTVYFYCMKTGHSPLIIGTSDA